MIKHNGLNIMAVLIDFFNIIVPIKTIESKYPGGWNACLNDHKNALGHTVWHDGHLFRDGAMNSIDFGKIIEFWERSEERRVGNVGKERRSTLDGDTN